MAESPARCPICRRTLAPGADMPFCSPRCRQIDLARWLDGSYRIPGPPADPAVAPPEEDD